MTGAPFSEERYGVREETSLRSNPGVVDFGFDPNRHSGAESGAPGPFMPSQYDLATSWGIDWSGGGDRTRD